MRKLLFIILCGIFLASPVLAQEDLKNQLFVLSDFSGGLSTKISDSSIDKKYARLAENVRLNDPLKSFSKRNQIYLYGTAVTSTEAITSVHRYYLSSGTKKLNITQGNDINVGNDATGAFTSILTLATSDYRWTWVTWHDLAIGGDGYNNNVKYNGTLATYLGACAAADNGAGAGPNGTYKYKVTFYTASYEVRFEVASAPVTVTDNDIDLTMIPIGPDTYLGETVTGRKVYRSDAGGAGDYDILTNGTIANNTATTLTDSDDDAACEAGTDYPGGTADWTPPKCKYWVVHKNRLFGAGNPSNPSALYYTKDSSHDLFEPTDYLNIRLNDGDEITFIKNLLGILRVGKTNSIQSVYTDGDDPDADWSVSDPFSLTGCDAPYSAAVTPLGIMFVSRAREGIYVFNGQSTFLKSEIITPTIQDISNSNLTSVSGEYNNNVYYLSYPSKAVGGSANNRMLVYDLLSDSFVIDTVGLSCLTSFNGGSDGGLLCAGSSLDGKVYTFGLTSQAILHGLHADFTGTFDDMRYIPTGSAIGGDPNNPILELAWDVTINGYGAGTINAATGDVNRPDGSGTYISQVLSTTGAATYDKIYWNEILPSGTDVTFAIRGGATAVACAAAGWSAEYSNPNGSDVSAVTAYAFTQYRITMSSSDIDYTPNVTKTGGFNTKLTYNTLGTVADTAIGIHWRTGYLDFGYPARTKTLRRLFMFYAGTNGTLTVTFTNEHGDTDTFEIDLSIYPYYYEESFTTGTFTGKEIQIDITNSDLNPVTIEEIAILEDIEPLV